jgi:hypothetical protein
MPALGKSLIFYCKYWTEMSRLCESEGDDQDSKLEGLPDPQDTREMAKQVETKANGQAVDFLEACAPEIERHFKSIGQCGRRTSRKIVERNWQIEFNIWPKNKHCPVRAKMTAGVSIMRLEKPEIVPWIWRHGGEEADKALEYILGNRVILRSRDFGTAGMVGLGHIPVLPENLDGFDADREPLVDQVQQAFRTFGIQDLDTLWPK